MRRTLVSLLLLVACEGVSETGLRGMRGVLEESGGSPVARQRVTSGERGVLTDDQGAFQLRWSEPDTHVDFNRGGLKWRRTWQRGSDSGEVRVRLPPVREGEITCRTELECQAELVWAFDDGLEARTRLQCGEKVPASVVRGLPVQLPEVRCSTILGDLDLDVVDDRGRVQIRSKPQPLPVEFEGGAAGQDCSPSILHGDVVEGVGAVGLRPTRATFAWAVCDGRAGSPVRAEPRDSLGSTSDATVGLPVVDRGVDLVLDPPLDEPRSLTLLRQTSSGAIDWEMRVEPLPGEPGRYLLPPLHRGDYRLGWGAPGVFGTVNPPDPEIPGTVVIVARSGPWGEVGGYVASLRLEEDTLGGELEVDGHPPESYLGDE